MTRKKTIKLFNEFFLDKGEHGSYFSHLDPIMLDPLSDTLGRNKGRKKLELRGGSRSCLSYQSLARNG